MRRSVCSRVSDDADDDDDDIADVLMLDVDCDLTSVSDVSDDEDRASLIRDVSHDDGSSVILPPLHDVSDDEDCESPIAPPLPGAQSSQATGTAAASDTAEVNSQRIFL